ncbi:MAG: hypothetical protein ABIJ34_02550 [archaeon]
MSRILPWHVDRRLVEDIASDYSAIETALFLLEDNYSLPMVQVNYDILHGFYKRMSPSIRRQISNFGGIQENHPDLGTVLYVIMADASFKGLVKPESSVTLDLDLENIALTPRGGANAGIDVYDVKDIRSYGRMLGTNRQFGKIRENLMELFYLEQPA